jgi:hypothetical protein
MDTPDLTTVLPFSPDSLNVPHPANGARRTQWHMPGSVLSALWGRIMPRLAARVWRTQFGLLRPGETRLSFPPASTKEPEKIGNLLGYLVEGPELEPFWRVLVEVSMGAQDAKAYLDGLQRDGSTRAGVTAGQRSALAVLRYFDPKTPSEFRIPVRFIDSESYDFILHSGGLDIFVPPNPARMSDFNTLHDFDNPADRERALAEILRMYRFRVTGAPPIGLPGVPATSPDAEDDYLTPTIQLAAPTGVSMAHEEWLRGTSAGNPKWYITGAVYRGIMAELPRIIASLWHEGRVWTNQSEADKDRTYAGRFRADLKELLEERLEANLPKEMRFDVGRRPPNGGGATWNPRDVMITHEGLVVPDPGNKSPDLTSVLVAIEKGIAGNPVFTDSGIPPE